MPTGEQSDGHSGSSSDKSGGRRKRSAELMQQQPQSEPCGLPGPRGDYEKMEAFQLLSDTQRAIIRRVVSKLDTESDSVVITNPLQPQGPIVYVTNAWQDMCGYNMQQAVGQNPRLTQGEHTDPDTVKAMKCALQAQQPCRVRIINYRGYNREPFWNCLSVQPIFFNRELVLFAARLQDYSHRLSPLVSLTPAQFCKSGDLYQMRVRLPELQSARAFSQARAIDVFPADLGWTDTAAATDGSTAVVPASSMDVSGLGGMPPPRHVKRLAFGNLDLEPEYLLDRLRHECAELHLPCQAQEVRVHGAEMMRMELSSAPAASSSSGVAGSSSAAGGGPSSSAGDSSSSSAAEPQPLALIGGAGAASSGSAGGLRALVHVMPEGSDGTYSISLMRLVGDTFEFHSLYRSLRERLTDIVVPPKPRVC